ncbi:MAG: aminotransferase class V-fold PLP-dependent enzyme [Anaerolineaceae bacterium]|nr:aminotransferase class V-fold PLP-dependent enzyme [Anaerolineaceae bacterium]
MKSNIDLNRARAETRYCNDVVHFNNAGAALMPQPVTDTLHNYLYKEERSGGYETAYEEQAALDHFYSATAKLLNCETDEIAFVENATRAWDMAFYSFKFSPGDKILTTLAEYGSNVIAYNQQAQRYGVELIFVPNDEFGQIDIHALENLVDDRVKLISISHIPTGGGLVNPAAAVGRVAQSAHIPYLLDATQSVGQLPLNVDDIGCDILCGAGRKYLRGPRGTGLLYVRQNLIEQLEPPLLDQHAATLTSPTTYHIRTDAKRFETWEQYLAGKAALGVAIDYALSYGLEAIQSRIYYLAEQLRTNLLTIDGVELTDDGFEKCGLVTFTAAQLSPSIIKQRLKAHRINVSTSTGSGSLVSFQPRGLTEVVRASVHYYNTDPEIAYFIEKLQFILSQKA